MMDRLPYVRALHLLTHAEREFYAILRIVAPDGLAILPAGALAGLVHVEGRMRQQYTHFNRIQATTVDFVLCDAATTEQRLVIELDDTLYKRSDRKVRAPFVDAVLAQVGLPIMHVPWQRSYDLRRLAEGRVRWPHVCAQTLISPAARPAHRSGARRRSDL